MSSPKQNQISDEMWDAISVENRLLIEQYLSSLTTVSDKTYIRYRTDVKQLAYWIHTTLNDKPFYEFNKYDFERYFQVMLTSGMKLNTIKSKRNGLLNLFNFIENVISKADENYEGYVNDFSEANIQVGFYDGESYPVTFEEYNLLMSELRQGGYLLACAWVSFMFYTGASITDSYQLSSDVVKFPFPLGADYVLSNSIKKVASRCLGEYNLINYKIRKETYDAIKEYIDSRGYESEYVFTSIYKGEPKVVNYSWALDLCVNVLSPIIGRLIKPADFYHSWEKYCEKRNNLSNSKKYLNSLVNIDVETQPINLVGYERDIKRILETT